MAAEKLNEVFCKGMGKEAMNINYPKIKDFKIMPTKNLKNKHNSDISSHLLIDNKPSSSFSVTDISKFPQAEPSNGYPQLDKNSSGR